MATPMDTSLALRTMQNPRVLAGVLVMLAVYSVRWLFFPGARAAHHVKVENCPEVGKAGEQEFSMALEEGYTKVSEISDEILFGGVPAQRARTLCAILSFIGVSAVAKRSRMSEKYQYKKHTSSSQNCIDFLCVNQHFYSGIPVHEHLLMIGNSTKTRPL